MQRVGISRNPALDLFGQGKHGFQAGNPQAGTPATTPGFEFFNAVQEELAGLVESVGLALDPNNRTQVKSAILSLISSYAAAPGHMHSWGQLLGKPTTAIGFGITDCVTKDAQGNIGIGVTPKTWGAQYPVIQQNAKTVYAADVNSSYYGTNWYHTAGTHKRLADGFSLMYQQDSSAGKHLWKTAPTGVADAIVAWTTPMSLDVVTGILDVSVGITTATPTAGDSSTKVATTAFVQNATIGNAQTWQSFTPGTQRVVGTTYYNATNKPIAIGIGWYMSASSLYYLYVNGVIVGEAGGGSAAVRGQLFGIVPPGASYQLAVSTGSLAIEYWAELR